MTIRYLLDTNIVVSVLRSRPEPLRLKLGGQTGRLGVSAVTVSELHYGVERSARPAQNRRAVEELLGLVVVLPFDEVAAIHAAEIRAQLAAHGTPIGGYDVLIAGHARSQGLTVVTNDVREFDRVPGLVVEDWSA
ncbi:MAG: type II toxin-antitoxin system VapC family toxin [Protaetiibacter sp.]